MRQWRGWCRMSRGNVCDVNTSRFTAELYGATTPCDIIEDPNGDYLGWFDSEEESAYRHRPPATEPDMIQHEKIFDIQFPYGSKASVDRGLGTIIRLRIEPQETK